MIFLSFSSSFFPFFLFYFIFIFLNCKFGLLDSKQLNVILRVNLTNGICVQGQKEERN